MFKKKCMGKYWRHKPAIVESDRRRILSETQHGFECLLYNKGRCIHCGKEGIMVGSSSWTGAIRTVETKESLDLTKRCGKLDSVIGVSKEEWI